MTKHEIHDKAAVIERSCLALAEASTFDEFAVRAGEALGELVDASQTLAFRYLDGPTPEGLGGTLLPALGAYLPEHFAHDPIHPYMASLSPRLLATPEKLDRRAFVRAPSFTDFYRPRDVAHLLGVWPTPKRYGEAGMMGFLLTRSEQQGEFRAEHLRLIDALGPHLRAAWRRCQRGAELERDARLAREALGSSGGALLVAVGRDGAPTWASPRLPGWCRGGDVDAVRRALGPRCAALLGAHASPLPGPVPLALGGTPCLADLSPWRDEANGAQVLIRVSVDARRAVTERYGLTPAESRVLERLGEGASNAEIARRLCVSVETVRTHVARVLAKTGAGSRAEAAARFGAASERAPTKITRSGDDGGARSSQE